MAIWRVPITVTDPRAGACINVWHVRTSGSNDLEGEQLNSAVAALRAFYFGQAVSFPTTCQVSADFAVEVQENRDRPVTFAKFSGTATGNQAPPHLAVCLNLKTSIRGRRARGRIFLGPRMTVDIDSDGSIGNPHLAALNTLATTLRDASVTDNGWAIGVWGLQNSAPKDYWKSGGTGTELPHVFRDVTAFQINDRFAVVRSRKPKT